MIFGEINPYIRFAQSILCRGTGERVLVRDCRLFYVTEGSGFIRIGDRQYRLLPGSRETNKNRANKNPDTPCSPEITMV